jgi:Domain of Unknown Function (DUF1080)
MTYSRREKICAVAAAGFVVGMCACTPATTDQPAGAGASPGTSGGSGTTAAGGNSVGSAGAPGSSGAAQTGGGAAGSDTVAAGASSLPASGAGGGAPTDGGAGGAVAAAGSNMGTAGSAGAGGATSGAIGCGWAKDAATGLWTMNPPAADKQVLYNGMDKGLNQWHRLNMPGTPAQWTVTADGWLEVVPDQALPTNIQSNAKFDDVCLHVEYLNAPFATNEPNEQKHGNSGIFLKSAYEMQVLDTHEKGPLIDGCGAVYKVMAPLVVACLQAPAWNVYEIEFKGSVWNAAGAKIKNAVFVQVTLNGKLVQQNVPLNPAGGFTEAGIPDVAGPQPIALQDHREPDDFRNIWAAVPRY